MQGAPSSFLLVAMASNLALLVMGIQKYVKELHKATLIFFVHTLAALAHPVARRGPPVLELHRMEPSDT